MAAPDATRPSPPPQELADNRELIRAVRALNATEFYGQNNELTFVLDRETRRPLVRIINRETKEVVLQIPPEHVLRMVGAVKHSR